MRKLFWIIIIAVIGFFVCYGIFPEVKDTVNGGLATAGGAAWTALSEVASSITSTPIYQQFHVLIWLAGGIVLTIAFQRLLRKHKVRVPLLQKSAPASGLVSTDEPKDIVFSASAKPTKVTSEPPQEKKEVTEEKATAA